MAAFPCFLPSFLSSVQSLCNSVIDYPRLALESRISRNPPRHRDRRSRLILLLEFFARIQQLMNRFFKFLECSNFPGRKDITFFVFKNRQPFSQVKINRRRVYEWIMIERARVCLVWDIRFRLMILRTERRGRRWCTARDLDESFKKLFEKYILYILINFVA